MPGTIVSGQDHLVINSHDLEIDSGVTTDNLNLILTFNLEDAVAAAWKQVFRYRLLLRMRLG